MGWLFVGAMIGITIGMFLMAAVSITRMRNTQAVADAVGVYLSTGTRDNWLRLEDAYKRLMAE